MQILSSEPGFIIKMLLQFPDVRQYTIITVKRLCNKEENVTSTRRHLLLA
jgi:hypothetical protein